MKRTLLTKFIFSIFHRLPIILKNTKIKFLRIIIVFLIKKLDKQRIKKGSFSYLHIPHKSIEVRKINDCTFGVFYKNKDIGWFFTSSTNFSDTAIFNSEIEAHICAYWFYTAITNIYQHGFFKD